MALTAREIAELAGARLIGDPEATVTDARPAKHAASGDLTFAVDARKLGELQDGIPSVVVVPPSLESDLPDVPQSTYLVSDEPMETVIRAMDQLRPPRQMPFNGISPDAVIAESAVLGENVTIYPGVQIYEDAVIGDRCTLFPGVIVGAGCQIGNDVQLDPYVVLYPDVDVGDNVEIQAGAVLGGDGFGFRTRDGAHERVKHHGTLRIGNNVEIGAGSTFDRAVFGRTIVGDGTKIGNLVAVAHNCELGKHNLLVSQVGFAGSVTSGDYVVCAGQVGVGDHVHLGDGCTLGAKAGVHRDMPGGQVYLGAPAAPISETTRQMMALRKLPELRQTVRRLENELAQLVERLKSADPDCESEEDRRAA